MTTFSQLPSGKWRAQIRQAGIYKAATFATKREARAWSATVEAQVNHVATGGYAPVPKSACLADLIDLYVKTYTKTMGRTKTATLAMLKRDIGAVNLSSLNAVVLRNWIDKRQASGAGGATIAGDLSYLSVILRWGKYARHLDVPEYLARQARASLAYRGMNTRSQEREREPSDDELQRLYALWDNNPRQRIPMTRLCQFALASGMRLGEICGLRWEDLNQADKTILIRDRKDPQHKHGNHQTVPLLPMAWAIVAPLLTDPLRGQPRGYLFGYNSASVSCAFTRGCKDVEPPILDLHFHDLRHRATSSFFRMGLDIPQVSILTGHKTWAMLRRYTKISAQDVHNTINKRLAL